MSFILVLSGVLEAYRHRAVANRTEAKFLLEGREPPCQQIPQSGPADDNDWWVAFSFSGARRESLRRGIASERHGRAGMRHRRSTDLPILVDSQKRSSYRIVKRAPGHSKNTGVC